MLHHLYLVLINNVVLTHFDAVIIRFDKVLIQFQYTHLLAIVSLHLSSLSLSLSLLCIKNHYHLLTVTGFLTVEQLIKYLNL
jgi:hypothetical protein